VKLFDVLGALVVAAWLVVAGLYVYQNEFDGPTQSREFGEGFVMHEGETWLVLQRDKEEVGYLHQTRTRLPEGWLVEYDMLMIIELLGTERAIDTSVKSKLDEEGFLREFYAEVSASSNTFKANGQVDGDTLHTSLDLGGAERTRTIELKEPPRLSASAFNQLLAAGQLEPGDEFAERFFDPTTMKMNEMVMEYRGEREVEVYEEKHQAHHIVQQLGSESLDVYVDDHGEILIQQFPLRIVGARIAAELGRTRASAFRRRLKDRSQASQAEQADAREEESFDLSKALEILSSGADQPDEDQPDALEPDALEPEAVDSIDVASPTDDE
jgi:hypothetical protein